MRGITLVGCSDGMSRAYRVQFTFICRVFSETSPRRQKKDRTKEFMSVERIESRGSYTARQSLDLREWRMRRNLYTFRGNRQAVNVM